MYEEVVLWVKRHVLEESMARDVYGNSFLSDWVGGMDKLLRFCNDSFKKLFFMNWRSVTSGSFYMDIT